MAEVADAFEQWMRDYVTDGVPASGINPPSKAEGRAIGALIEAYIADAISAASITTPVGPGGPYVMPTYVAAGATSAVAATATPAFHTGVAADDIALMQVSTFILGLGSVPPDPVRPSGWTQIGSLITEGNTKHALYWKRCDGSETSATISLASAPANGYIAAKISGWRGCVANGDPYEAIDTDHGTGSPAASRAVTTLGAERRAVLLWCLIVQTGSFTSDPDTGFTEVFETVTSGLGILQNVFIADAQSATSATTIAAASRTSSIPVFNWASFSLALLPST